MPRLGAGLNSGSSVKSDSERTSNPPSMDWTSDSDERCASESYDECKEKSPSVVGGVTSAAHVAGSGRVAFGRKICVRR